MSWGGDMAIFHTEIGLFRHLKQTKKRGQFSRRIHSGFFFG